jgi:two-component system chemotaxis sensor kinase CheA
VTGPDPYRYFRVEAAELSDELAQGVLMLERAPPDQDIVARLLRAAHTLKGAARVVQQADVADRAHRVEDLLAANRDTGQPLPAPVAGQLLELIDGVRAQVRALGGATIDADTPDGARRDPSSPAAPAPGPVDWRLDGADVDGLLDAIGDTRRQLAGARDAVATLEHFGQGAQRTALVSLVRTIERTARELQQVQTSAESLRLAPAAALFPVLARAARDAAAEQQRSVAFAGTGGDIRVDPVVLSTVGGAMLHAVRNAVVHGIEPEAQRRAEGKTVEGHIGVEVSRRGNRVAFACRDDGRGFDLEALRRAARRTGRVGDAGRLNARELIGLALTGGMSTSDAVTEMSGRGIGLDAVRAVAERLGGDVEVRTDRGAGTTVEVVVPLSLVSFEGLLVEVAGTTATLPLESVRHTMRLRPAGATRSTAGTTLPYEGGAIPYLPLAPMLAATRPGAAGPSRHDAGPVAVVVSAGGGTAAVGVDRLLGTAPVVMCALPDLAPASGVVGGVSFDVDGVPRIVFDPPGLVERAQPGSSIGPIGPLNADAIRRRRVLVIDDSLTTRMLERSILESAGYEVDVACSGEEGWSMAHEHAYALFLVDIEMPGMDGFTFVERARADPALRDVPSILVSSRASAEDRARGVEAGARMHVAKNEFNQTELLATIERLVA